MRIVCDEGKMSTEQMAILERAARLCLDQEDLPADNVEISLSFVDEEEIRDLNSRYRRVDKVTDVLSFPMIEDIEEQDWSEDELLLGDVVICLDRARQQAEEYGHSARREITYLFVHSVLHLLGWDHMDEAERSEMRAREEQVMEKLNLRREEE